MGMRRTHGTTDTADVFYNVMVKITQSDPKLNVVRDGNIERHIPVLEITTNGIYLYTAVTLEEAEFIPTANLVRLQIRQLEG
jgi:hypothetical protein